jgi:hypothetical protein
MNFSSDLVRVGNLLPASTSALSITRSQRDSITDPQPEFVYSQEADGMFLPSGGPYLLSPFEMVHLAAPDHLTALAVRANILPPLYLLTRWEDDAFFMDGHVTTDLILGHRYVTSTMMFHISDRLAFPTICKAVATDRGIELLGWVGVWRRLSVQEYESVDWLLVPTLHGSVVVELEPAARTEILEFSYHVEGYFSTFTGAARVALGRFYRLVLTLNAMLAVHGDPFIHDELIEHVFLLARRSEVRMANAQFLLYDAQRALTDETYVTLEYAGLTTSPGAYRYFDDVAVDPFHRLMQERAERLFVEPDVFDAQDKDDATPADYDDIEDPADWVGLYDYDDYSSDDASAPVFFDDELYDDDD